jgi:branched-chain amino acid transport system substrate-binding protein
VGAVYGMLTAKLISQAYLKAGKAKTEAFIDAVEGMTVDSPIGR